MDEIKVMRSLEVQLEKVADLTPDEQLRVLAWLDAKVQEMVRAKTKKGDARE